MLKYLYSANTIALSPSAIVVLGKIVIKPTMALL